jgi:phytoene desaturase
MAHFIDANFDSVLDLVKPWRAGLELVRLGGFGKLGRKVASFFDDERLQRIFSFQSMYAGLAPYEALSLYAVITYMDSVEGVFVPEGGMHAMATGLAAAVEKAGVTIRYNSPVTRICARAAVPSAGSRSGAANASPPMSWCATPTCPLRTAHCWVVSTHPGWPVAVSTRRAACCGWPV